MASKHVLVANLNRPRYRKGEKFSPMFKWIKEQGIILKNVLEVGVYDGGNAQNILLQFPEIEKFYMIDPWGFEDGVFKKDAQGYGRCLELQKIFPKIDMTPYISEEGIPIVIKKIGSVQLDAVYIDSVHNKKCVKMEVAALWNSIREGGVLGGHDFTNRFDKETLNNYIIGDMARKYNRVIHLGLQSIHPNELNNFDWWIVK